MPGAEVTYLAREVGWDKPLGIVCDTDSGWSGRIEEDARALGSGLVRSRVISTAEILRGIAHYSGMRRSGSCRV